MVAWINRITQMENAKVHETLIGFGRSTYIIKPISFRVKRSCLCVKLSSSMTSPHCDQYTPMIEHITYTVVIDTGNGQQKADNDVMPCPINIMWNMCFILYVVFTNVHVLSILVSYKMQLKKTIFVFCRSKILLKFRPPR